MPSTEILLILLIVIVALTLVLQFALLLRSRSDTGTNAKLDALKDDRAGLKRELDRIGTVQP